MPSNNHKGTMKTLSSSCRLAGKLLVIGVFATGLPVFALRAGEPGPAAERAETLERRARQLRADDEQERAEALIREAQQLRRRGELPEPGGDGRGNGRRQEIERQLDQARAELAG